MLGTSLGVAVPSGKERQDLCLSYNGRDLFIPASPPGREGAGPQRDCVSRGRMVTRSPRGGWQGLQEGLGDCSGIAGAREEPSWSRVPASSHTELGSLEEAAMIHSSSCSPVSAGRGSSRGRGGGRDRALLPCLGGKFWAAGGELDSLLYDRSVAPEPCQSWAGGLG